MSVESARPHTARAEAVRQLIRVERDRAHIAWLDADFDDPRDARLVSDLVAGVTRLRRWLDFLITHFYHGDINALDTSIRQVLRIGLYELLERGTPPHAAVSEAVDTAKTVRGKGAAALVNAVLRAAVRTIEANELPIPDTGKPVRDLAIRHSHPTWLVRRWLDRFGEEETVALLKSNNARPSYGLRINVLRTTLGDFGKRLDDLGVAWRPSEYLDDFAVVEQLQPIIRAGLLAEGLCAVQDEAAGLVVRILAPQPGETILDGAAAPGGKALYAAQLMGNEGRIVAVDLHEARTRLIRKAAEEHSFSIIEPQTADLRAATFDTQFDRVLLDAPCSGLGVLAKRADLRWRANPEKIEELVALQDELLDAAARHVRPGGLLVYSTCTIAPEENGERVRAFLERHSTFSIEPVSDAAPMSMRTEEGFFATFPHIHRMDGAFAVRLRKALGGDAGMEHPNIPSVS